MQNASGILLLFCIPIWPSNHVNASHEYVKFGNLHLSLTAQLLLVDLVYVVFTHKVFEENDR